MKEEANKSGTSTSSSSNKKYSNTAAASAMASSSSRVGHQDGTPSSSARGGGDDFFSAGDYDPTATATSTSSSAPNVNQTLHFKGKLVLLGDIAVGKTAIVTRCEDNKFVRDQKTTIGVAFSQKEVRIENAVVNLDLWDSAGEERFRSINSLYYHGSAAGIIVFDMTKRSTFESAKSYWIPHLREHGVEDIIIALVANKADLLSSRQVSREEAVELASVNKTMYFETSAKSGDGVHEVFRAIAREVPKGQREQRLAKRASRLRALSNDVGASAISRPIGATSAAELKQNACGVSAHA